MTFIQETRSLWRHLTGPSSGLGRARFACRSQMVRHGLIISVFAALPNDVGTQSAAGGLFHDRHLDGQVVYDGNYRSNWLK